MDIVLPLLIIVGLIVLNGLFVAAEFAIIGAPRAAIERRAAAGQPAARLVQQILHNPRQQDRYIATAQLGITFASLGLGMYGEHVLADWLFHLLDGLGTSRWIAAHALASVLAIILLTYFHIVLGEMVPKSLALMQAERTVLRIIQPMLWIKTALYPLVVGLNGLGNGLLKLMGIERQLTTGYYHTPEELQFIIEESQEGGMLQAEAGQMLRDLFEFGERTAAEIMVPRVHARGIPLGATPAEMAEVLRTARHTRYPVFEDSLDQIVGMIHIKDILRLLVAGRPLVRDDLRPTVFVPETARLDAVLEMMRRARTHMVIVIDEHGGTAGLASIEDLSAEVVGEIDESPEAARVLFRDVSGRLHVAGTMRLDEVGEQLDMALAHDEVDTVSGLVLTLLARAPAVGDVVSYAELRLEVAAVEGHGVRECIITPQRSSPLSEEATG